MNANVKSRMELKRWTRTENEATSDGMWCEILLINIITNETLEIDFDKLYSACSTRCEFMHIRKMASIQTTNTGVCCIALKLGFFLVISCFIFLSLVFGESHSSLFARIFFYIYDYEINNTYSEIRKFMTNMLQIVYTNAHAHVYIHTHSMLSFRKHKKHMYSIYACMDKSAQKNRDREQRQTKKKQALTKKKSPQNG